MRTCYNIRFFLPLALVFLCLNANAQKATPQNIYDTLLTNAVVYNGDTLEAKMLAGVYVWPRRSKPEWTRLRNAVYVTYPYALKAANVFNDIENHIANNPDKKAVTKYINSREKELKKEFSDPLKNLSVYQGKVLMKLINRQTGGTNCYEILKELKGGFTARLWQTVAFFFGSDLKQPYDAYGKDAEMESIVHEVRRMYGYPS
ncbi:MAG: DUF4294 domain-containing protein [Bacteroidetes bacterium]|nr:DUF4294 domain-containing protein [Bacteroidota bacterium]